jgi:3-deoxy-D-arabino-heptulosonate 7-phosphate (DAHP) synthase
MRQADDEIIEIQVKQTLIYNFEHHNASDKFLPQAEICTVIRKTIRRFGRLIKTISVEDSEILMMHA